jgi:glycosyltransferase involved in cell wall biosynthesis
VQTLARALVGRGQQVTVIGFSEVAVATREDDAGVEVLRLPRASIPALGFFVNGFRLRYALRKVHRDRPIDVLEGQENAFAALPRMFPAPRLIRMHGGHHFFQVTLGKRPRPWRSWLEKRSFDRAEHLCAVSSFVANTTRKLLRLDGRRIEVIPNPVDTDKVKPLSGVATVPGRIVFVGTVCEKKGVRQLIQAMPAVISKVPGAHLQIVGPDRKDRETGSSYIEGLRNEISPELEAHIRFLGRIGNSEVPAILASAEVLAYPSHMEAMPLVWLEGMAARKPVVASTLGPGPEVIADGVDGLLCNPLDPNSIAQALIRALTDASLRETLSANARARAVQSYSISRLVDSNLEYYEACARHRRSGS